MFAFAFVLAFLLLLVTFRSVVIPLTAIILNLLWVAAAYGVLVLIFQDGRLQSLLDFQSVGGITAWLPLLFLGRLPAHRVGFFERELLDSDFIKRCARLVESQCLLTLSRRAEGGRDLDVSLCFGFAVAKGEMASFPPKLSHYPRPCLYLVSELNLI